MRISSRNPYTGRNSPGYRFCFHVRAIAHRSIFLPLAMKDLPEIQRLLGGESPLAVFNCDSYQEARLRFAELRKQHDFAFWAVMEYRIRDINDADSIIPLRLNAFQHHLIDILQRRYHDRRLGRYIITKSFPRCGVTTCVQAYITWLQTYQCRNSSCFCSSSDINVYPHKTDLCRWLRRDVVPAEKWLFLPRVDGRAFFNTFRNPNMCRGINLGYVHLADMSKWNDSDGTMSQQVLRAAVSGVLMAHFTLVVFEGNVPKPRRFPLRKHLRFNLPWQSRFENLRPLTKNPFFLDHVAYSKTHPDTCPFTHIDLDRTFLPNNPA